MNLLEVRLNLLLSAEQEVAKLRKVADSLPGEHRETVSQTAERLEWTLKVLEKETRDLLSYAP